MGCRALAIEVSGGNPSVRILGTIAKCGRQCGATAFIVVRILTIVDGAVNGNCPHGGGIAIAVAIILLAAIARRPDVDVAQAISTLQGGQKLTMFKISSSVKLALPHSHPGQ